LPGTALARLPFWAPDSRSIGFFADGKLKTMSAIGGPARALCDVDLGGGGTWNAAGTIVFANTTEIFRVNASGGDCVAVRTSEPGIPTRFPTFLPDGRHLFHVVVRGDDATRGVYVAALDGGPSRRILADISSVAYAAPAGGRQAGALVFLRDNALMMQPFDPGTMQVQGEAIQIATHASFSNTLPQMAASISDTGSLVFLANGETAATSQLTWIDRSGKSLSNVTKPDQFLGVGLGPDQQMAVVSIGVPNTPGLAVLWLRDLARNAPTRFTEGGGGTPVWTHDGREIVFGKTRPGNASQDLYRKAIGGAPEELLFSNDHYKAPSDLSADGRFLVYTEVVPTTGADIWAIREPLMPDAASRRFPIVQTSFMESQGQLSPDGRWLAYVSDESGRQDVYVRPFPMGDGKWPVSTAGGREPRWRRDGKELFYLEGVLSRVQLKAVPVNTASGRPTFGTSASLFEFRANTGTPQVNWFVYSPSADGQRFLVSRLASDMTPTVDVLLHWQQRLK
jgi:hypothetical protein